jgi:hypothetical protein
MKRFFGLALFAAVAAAPVALAAQTPAQERGPRATAAPAQRALALRAELGLSAEQVSRLEAIQQRLQAQNAPLIAQLRASGVPSERPAMTPEQREARRKQVQEHGRARTPEQRQQMRERMQARTPEQREQMRERMQARTPEQREQMREGMQTMTPEQRQQMHERMQAMTPEQREAHRREMQARRGDPQARPAQPGMRAEQRVPEELRPVMQQMRENTRAAAEEARAVLTSEQHERLRELAHQRRGEGWMRRGPAGQRSR